MIYTKKEVIELIRGRIKDCGTQAAFAKKVGITPAYLCEILQEKRSIGIKVLKYLGLEICYQDKFKKVKS